MQRYDHSNIQHSTTAVSYLVKSLEHGNIIAESEGTGRLIAATWQSAIRQLLAGPEDAGFRRLRTLDNPLND